MKQTGSLKRRAGRRTEYPKEEGLSNADELSSFFASGNDRAFPADAL